MCLTVYSTTPYSIDEQIAGIFGANVSDLCILRILPHEVNASLGEVFTVDVAFENMNKTVCGCEFKIIWNPNSLQCLSMEEVAFHAVTPEDEQGSIAPLMRYINNSVGYAWYAYTWADLNGALTQGYGRTLWHGGTGAWAKLTFNCTGPGPQTLHMADVTLGDFNALRLNGATVDCEINMVSIAGDINHDGIVDIYDAIILAGNYGKTA